MAGKQVRHVVATKTSFDKGVSKMETLYLEKLHLNAHLAAKQAYITQL